MNNMPVIDTLGEVGTTVRLTTSDVATLLPSSVLINSSGRRIRAAIVQHTELIPASIYIKGDNFAPNNMTDYAVPAPFVVTALEDYLDLYAWQAFDGVWPVGGWGTDTATAAWLSLDIGVGQNKRLYSYRITVNEWNLTTSPKDWKLYGSLNEVDWAELDSQVDQSDWDTDPIKEFVIDASLMSVAYRYFKLDVLSENGGHWIFISEIELFEAVVNPGGYTKLASGAIPSETEAELGICLRDGDGPIVLVGEDLLANLKYVASAYSTGVLNITPFYR